MIDATKIVRQMKPELLTREELLRQADDYFAIATQDNLDPENKDRLRRAATAMTVCATRNDQ